MLHCLSNLDAKNRRIFCNALDSPSRIVMRATNDTTNFVRAKCLEGSLIARKIEGLITAAIASQMFYFSWEPHPLTSTKSTSMAA